MSIYCAREFSAEDIQTIKRLMEQDPKLKRTPLPAQTVRVVRLDQTQRRVEGHDMPRGAAAHAALTG